MKEPESSRGSAFELSVTPVTADSLLHPTIPPLAVSEIHLWEFPLTVADSALADLETLLSEDERVRAARFHAKVDGQRFTVGRGIVRLILGSYLGKEGREVQFLYWDQGKPRLKNTAIDLRFNVSHSGNRGLLAVSLGQELGVDIEAIRPDVECEKVAERFFSPHERESLRRIKGEEQVRAFFKCWTCKESFLKAQGVGLSRSLSSFDIDLEAERVRLAATRPDAREAQKWSLFEIEAAEGYAAAVCVDGWVGKIRKMQCAG